MKSLLSCRPAPGAATCRHQALVFTAAVRADQSVGAGAKHAVIGDDEARALDQHAGQDLVLAARIGLELVAALHLPRLVAFVHGLAADALEAHAESQVARRLGEFADGLAAQRLQDLLVGHQLVGLGLRVLVAGHFGGREGDAVGVAAVGVRRGAR